MNPSRETKFSGANGGMEIIIFPVQLTTSRIGNLTRLILILLLYVMCLQKNQNAARPSEHPPVRGENVKTFRWDHSLGCKYKTSSWHSNGFHYGSNIGSAV